MILQDLKWDFNEELVAKFEIGVIFILNWTFSPKKDVFVAAASRKRYRSRIGTINVWLVPNLEDDA